MKRRKSVVVSEIDDDLFVGEGLDSSLAIYLREISRYPLLTRKQEKELGRRKNQGDLRAFEQLVVSNLRFVVTATRGYRNLGVALGDLINEGNLGLIHAVEEFDPDLGYRLITYAVHKIKQKMRMLLSNHARTVRIPAQKVILLLDAAEYQSDIMQKQGRKPKLDEIAAALDVTPEILEEVIQASQIISLDAPLQEDDDATLGELMEDERAEDVSATATHNNARDFLRDLMSERLSGRGMREILQRYGFDDDDPWTLDEVGGASSVTREGARQSIARNLKRLKAALRRRGIKKEDDIF